MYVTRTWFSSVYNQMHVAFLLLQRIKFKNPAKRPSLSPSIVLKTLAAYLINSCINRAAGVCNITILLDIRNILGTFCKDTLLFIIKYM